MYNLPILPTIATPEDAARSHSWRAIMHNAATEIVRRRSIGEVSPTMRLAAPEAVSDSNLPAFWDTVKLELEGSQFMLAPTVYRDGGRARDLAPRPEFA